MNHPESAFQTACRTWFELQYPRFIFAAFANGGKRNAREAARMKGEGVKAGMPDVEIIIDNGKHLYIELKAPGNKKGLSEKQAEIHWKLKGLDHSVYVCWTLDEFISTVNDFILWKS